MRRNVLNSPRLSELKKKRRRAIFNKILISLLGFSAIVVALVYLSRMNSLKINDVEITGNKVVDAQAIKEVVESQLAGKYLWFFPKSNVLLYPENSIKNELQNKFQRLQDINISIKSNKTLEISVTERVATYTWCGAIPSADEESCYFLDANGYLFDTAPYFSGEVYFKFYGGDLSPGSYFFQQNFKQLISFKDILIGLGLKPVALYETSDGDIQIFLTGGTSLLNAPKIILKADADFQNVAENLQAALQTEPLQSKFKNNYSSLQYIDLRFDNKVYDKFSN